MDYILDTKNTLPLIKAINESPIKVNLMEMGAGVGISSQIFKVEGASKTISSVISLYDKSLQKNRLGLKERSVALESCHKILENMSDEAANTKMVTTFQLPSDFGSTKHGWVGLEYGGVRRYYHVTLPPGVSREDAINLYSFTGLKILYSRNVLPIINSHVDAIYDHSGNIMLKETLHAIKESYNSGYVFKKSLFGKVSGYRIESILRSKEKTILFKGSFNPHHIGHRKMMEKASTYTFNNGLSSISKTYVLSFDNREKGSIDENEMSFRLLNLIEAIDVDNRVLVYKKPYFKDLISFIGDRASKEGLIFPMGLDTFNRLVLDHDEDIFKTSEGVVFKRDGEVIEDHRKDLNVSFINFKEEASSTSIRNHFKSLDH